MKTRSGFVSNSSSSSFVIIGTLNKIDELMEIDPAFVDGELVNNYHNEEDELLSCYYNNKTKENDGTPNCICADSKVGKAGLYCFGDDDNITAVGYECRLALEKLDSFDKIKGQLRDKWLKMGVDIPLDQIDIIVVPDYDA